MDSYQSLFDNALEGKPVEQGETDYHSFFSNVLEAGKAAFNTRLFPDVGMENVTPKTTLGEAANMEYEGMALPGTLARKAAETISPEGSKEELFRLPGTSPIPGLGDMVKPTVAGGAEFAGNILAPSAIGLTEGLMQEAGTRLPRTSPEVPKLQRPFDVETTLESPTNYQEVFNKEVIPTGPPIKGYSPEINQLSEEFAAKYGRNNHLKNQLGVWAHEWAADPKEAAKSIDDIVERNTNTKGTVGGWFPDKQVADMFKTEIKEKLSDLIPTYQEEFDKTVGSYYPDSSLEELSKQQKSGELDKYRLDNPRVREDGYGIGTSYETLPEPGPNQTVYRAVPLNYSGAIKPGQFITASEGYATEHGELHKKNLLNENPSLKEGYKIISASIPKKELVVMGGNELIWFPKRFADSSETGSALIPNVKGLRDQFAAKMDISGQYNELQHEKAQFVGDLAEKDFKDSLNTQSIFKDLTPAENRAVAYVAEGGTIPEPYLKDPQMKEVVDLIQHPNEKVLGAVEKWKAHFATKAAEGQDLFDPRTSYAPLILNPPSSTFKVESGRVDKATGNTPFARERMLDTKADYLNAGHTEKFRLSSEEMNVYNKSVNQAIAQHNFTNLVLKMKDVNGEPFSYPKKVKDKDGKLVPNKKLPPVVKNGAELSPLLKDVYLTPDVYKRLQFLKGLEKPGSIGRAYDQAGALMKSIELGLSLFHYMTLTESAVALGAVNPVRIITDVVNSFKVGGASMLRPELTADALKHNLGLDPSENKDIETGVINRMTDNISRSLNAVIDYSLKKLGGREKGVLYPDIEAFRKALFPAIKLEAALNFSLWKAYQPALKLYAYEINVAIALKKFPGIAPDVVKRQVADVVNSYMGTQVMRLVFDDPRIVRSLSRVFMAADWTLSNVRIPASLVNEDVKGNLGRKAYARMAALFLMSTYAASVINKKIQGEPDWALGNWSNDKGHKFDLFLYRDEDGMAYYATINKGFVEIFRWMTNPLEEGAHKANPAGTTVVEQTSKHSLTGFDLQFNRPTTIDKEFPYIHPEGRLKALGKKFTPFTLGNGSFMGMLPVSKAISITNLKAELERALYQEDDKKIDELREIAGNNGITDSKFNKILNSISYTISGREKLEGKGGSGHTANYANAMTGFKLRALNEAGAAKLQSLLDRLKNDRQKD